MDEPQDKNLQPDGTPGKEPAEGETPLPEPRPQDASADSVETPDAIKAMTNDAAETAGDAPSDDGGTEKPQSDEQIDIKEPSMDFSEPVPAAGRSAEMHRAEFPQLGEDSASGATRNIDLLMDVKLPVAIELGRTTLSIAEILEWGQGSVIELDKLAGEPVDLFVNNKLVAKGEVVVIDEKFGMRITSLIANPESSTIAPVP